MTDMNPTIVAKSSQLNADDLISGPITIKIRDTKVSAGGEQPVAIFYEGDNGKPWMVCKSMCRVLVSAWGPNSKAYIGKSLTLFRDPHVKWAGMEVGGIRISHMSDIGGDQTIPITVTRGNKKPYLVKSLKTESAKPAPTEADKLVAATKKAEAIIAEIQAAEDVDVVVEKNRDVLDRLEKAYPALNAKINDALKLRETEGE